jgi:transposase
MIPHFYGFDIHQKYIVAAAVDREQHMNLAPERVSMDHLADWVARHLTAADTVVVEAGTNAFHIADLLAGHVKQVVVANPYKTKLIAEAQIKNDKVDALALAKLLAANLICDVWIPSAQVREQRTLSAHRASLQQRCTQVKNQLHNMCHRRSQQCPESSLFTAAGRQWLLDLPLPDVDRMRIRHLLQQLECLEEQLDETNREVARRSAQDERIPRLMQICGVGYYTAYAILACIGNIQRFPSGDKLAAYAGLVPRQYQTGNRAFFGHITKCGNPLLRWLLVEAARSAVRYDPHWHQIHDRIARRRGSNIATVAVARKLLVVIWHLLTEKSVYRHLRPQTFVTKLQEWAFRIGRNHLPANSSKEFVYDHLSCLGLYNMAESLAYKGKNCRLRLQAA